MIEPQLGGASSVMYILSVLSFAIRETMCTERMREKEKMYVGIGEPNEEKIELVRIGIYRSGCGLL